MVKPRITTGPLVSVIIAVYNGAETLQRCLNSIVNQSYQRIELIVIDGVSTDGTLDILEENQDKIAYWESKPDHGIYDAWNKGLHQASGDWICFLGADDYFWEETVVMAMIPALEKAYPLIRVLYGTIAIVDEVENVLGYSGKHWRLVKKDFSKQMMVPHPGLMHHKTIFEDYGKFDDSFKIAGDYDLLLRVLSNSDAFFIPNLVTVGVQMGGVSDSQEYAIDMSLEVRRAHRKAGYKWDGILWWQVFFIRMFKIVLWNLFGEKYAVFLWGILKKIMLKIRFK